MNKEKLFKTKIKIVMPKYHYNDGIGKGKDKYQRLVWLTKNLEDGTWTQGLGYSRDHQKIICTYSFKNPVDATLFGLIWA